MTQYGGNLRISLPDEHEYESHGEYKYISVKYLVELFSHRDEYKEMFEEYFQKYKDMKYSDENKDFVIKRLTKALLQYKDHECEKLCEEEKVRDKEVSCLKEEIIAKSKENDELCHQLTISQAKVERAYQLKYEEEVKVNDLTKKVTILQKKIKELVTTAETLRAKTQRLKKGYVELKQENLAKEKANKDLEIVVAGLLLTKEEMSLVQSDLTHEHEEVLKKNKVLKQELDANKHVFMEMQKLININCKLTESKTFKLFRKHSKKAIANKELKLMLEKTISNI